LWITIDYESDKIIMYTFLLVDIS